MKYEFEQDVTEEVTENVEPATEETEVVEQEEPVVEEAEQPKYTESQLQELIRKNVSRNEAKLRKQFDRDMQKHRNLANVLQAGTGTEDVEEMTNTFRKFYEEKGLDIPKEPRYSERDIEVLARAEADEIISLGFDDVVEEVDRLAKIGVANMNPREKAMFKQLAEYRTEAEKKSELAKIGVTEDVYASQEFKDFAKKFNPNTPITEIFNIYNQKKPKTKLQTAGSMTSTQAPKVKDYYSPEEIERLTEEDLDNPKVWEAVRRSMTGGKK